MDDNTAPVIEERRFAARPIEQTVIGYQWGDDMSFIGTYPLVCLDPDAIHLPPRTTLIAPPLNLPLGREAAFDIALGAWIERDEDLSWMGAETLAAFRAAQAAAAMPPRPEVTP